MVAALNVMSEQKATLRISKRTPIKPRRLNYLQAARLAERSLSTVRRAVARGNLRAITIEGRRFVLYRDLVSWLTYDPLDSD